MERAIADRVRSLGLGEFHWGRAPRKTAMPYVTGDPPASAVREYDSSRNATEDDRLRLHVWANTLDTAKENVKALTAGFVGRELRPAAGCVLLCLKLGDELLLDLDPDESGLEVWHGILDLTFLAVRQPGQ